MPKIALSTTSVFPESTASGFEYAARLGYDGVEVMVSGLDSVCTDPDALERLRDYHQVPVLAVHAPCLLVAQRTWGTDPWEKLERSAKVARQLGADIVVVHPPFRWQVAYARNFVQGCKRLTQTTGVTFCIENMYPWRTPGGEVKMYGPTWNVGELDYPYLTLDLSHASTARMSSLDYIQQWGERLRHVHLTDGGGSAADEHLLPGYGDQRAAEVLATLACNGFDGHVVLEVNTRKAGSRGQREADLAEALDFSRTHLR